MIIEIHILKMKTYKKKNLRFEYNWNDLNKDDNKWIKGFPDNKMLNRYEGYEVLYFLKRYMIERNYQLEDTLDKLETAIRESMPSEIRSHSDVKKWLDHNCCF